MPCSRASMRTDGLTPQPAPAHRTESHSPAVFYGQRERSPRGLIARTTRRGIGIHHLLSKAVDLAPQHVSRRLSGETLLICSQQETKPMRLFLRKRRSLRPGGAPPCQLVRNQTGDHGQGDHCGDLVAPNIERNGWVEKQ